MNRLVVIDGNAIIHRAYHALPPLTDKNGRIVNAVYGFTSMLLKVWHDLQPTHMAVTFDMAGPTFRHKKFKEYKATRVKADQELYDQIPLVHDVVLAFNIPVYEKEGYEADDVIGTIVREIGGVCHPELASGSLESKTRQDRKMLKQVQYDRPEVYIVTGDMDTLQLVQPGVKVYTLRKGISDVVIYGEEEMKKRFGFGPEFIVDYKALAGDGSDNIPGVPGIGKKTATELIKEIGGLEAIHMAIELENSTIRDSVIKKLKQGWDSAIMSRELAQIDCHVPGVKFKLDNCKLVNFDKNKVLRLFQEYEFVSLLKRVPGMQDIRQDMKIEKTGGTEVKDFKFTEVKQQNQVDDLLKLVKKTRQFACRAVVIGQNILLGELAGLVFVIGHQGYWLENKFLAKVDEIFQDDEMELVGHDLKQLLKAIGPVRNKLFDVMIASYLLNPGSRAHDPASIVLKILGKELPAGSGQESLFGADSRIVAHELWLISQMVDKLKKELDKVNNLGLLEKIEMPLVPILAKMELNGVSVDLSLLKDLSRQVAYEIKKVTKSVHKMAGQEFNIASPIQLREILFDKLEIPSQGVKKGKTGLSTSAEQLEKLRGAHPIIDEIENHRELTKLQNTYIDVLPTLVNKKTKRIHTSFNQAVTATGRLSSSDPNLQNIPIRTELGREIRKAFIADSGNMLVVADYSQIELRIVASLAKDEKMMEIFNLGEDIHQATAAALNGVPLDKVTMEMRRAAKEINFGVLYGMGSYGLSWRAGIPVWQAKDFIAKYFAQFSGVKKYIDETLEFTKREGYCETLFGRRRYLPELNSPNFQLRGAAERMAINHPVQGTAADLMKLAMIAVDAKLKEENNVRIILQVHDELVLEVKKGLESKVGKIVKQAMEDVVKLNVPVRVDVRSGKRWGEIK